MNDLISRQAAIDTMCELMRHWFGCDPKDEIREIKRELDKLPSAQPKTDEENELKFYYVESIDDYWIGQRLDNFYYADWHDGFRFVWSHSRYLPWGEHIVSENTLWKEHKYPSEPIEMPFTQWIIGFMKKYSAEPKTGGEIGRREHDDIVVEGINIYCPDCGYKTTIIGTVNKPNKEKRNERLNQTERCD